MKNIKFTKSRYPYKYKLRIKVWFFIFVLWINEKKTFRLLLFEKYGFIYHLKYGGIRIAFNYYDWDMHYSIKKMTLEQRLKFRECLNEIAQSCKRK